MVSKRKNKGTDIEFNILAEFLKKGRTQKEILDYFNLSSFKEVKLLLEQSYDGFNIFEHRNSLGEPIFLLLAEEKNKRLEINSRLWFFKKRSSCAVTVTDEIAPLLWIQFPDTIWDEIIVVPTSDVHLGQSLYDEESFKRHIDWILRQENCFTFLLGDIMENALASSPGGAIFEQALRPKRQRERLAEMLAPIAHKILWAIPGNHEERSIKLVDIDPLEIVCKDLNNIPYFDEPVFVNILWKGCVFTFYVKHGRTSSRTPGGRVNAAARSLKHQEFIMFTIMGHVHQKEAIKKIRFCRVRNFDANGRIIDFSLKERKQYVINCSGFASYYGAYPHRSEFDPPTKSGVACLLYANGDYHVPMDTRQRGDNQAAAL